MGALVNNLRLLKARKRETTRANQNNIGLEKEEEEEEIVLSHFVFAASV